MARKLLCCLLFLTLVLFPSCSATNRGVTRTLTAMDTVIHVTFYEDSEVYFDVFAEEIARLDRIWSVTDEKGEVFSFNQTHNTSQFSAETFRLLRESLSWCRVTDYALDVSLLPVSKLWSFGSNAPRIPNQSEIQSALSLCGSHRILVTDDSVLAPDGTMLDFGATAKGLACDILAEKFYEIGCESAVFSLGGNVRTMGNKPDGSPWKIAIQDPTDSSKALISLSFFGDLSIATSGSYQRYFEKEGVRYCHILDPDTGYPVQNELLSVSVICKSGIQADALTTALFVMGKEKAIHFYETHHNFEMILMATDGSVLATDGLKDMIDTSDFDSLKIQWIESHENEFIEKSVD